MIILLPKSAVLKALLLFFNLLLFSCGYSQVLQAAPAATRTGTYGTAQTNALHVAANQAALAYFKHFSAAVYGERRFLLQELSTYYATVAQPVGDGAFGVQLFYSGNADYNASKVGLAYGRSLGKKVSVGLQFNYINQHLRGYGNAAQVSAEGGMLVRFSEGFHAGFQVRNPAGVTFNKAIEKLPPVYTAGFTYQPAQQLGITAELIKTAALPIAVQTGLEYRFAPAFWAKAGIASGTAAFFIAAGFQLKDFSIEVAGSAHPQLGVSPGLLLLYNDMGK